MRGSPGVSGGRALRRRHVSAHPPVTSLLLLVAAGAMVGSALSPQGLGLLDQAASAATGALATVSASFAEMFPTAQLLGMLPAGQTLDVGVSLPDHNDAGLQSFIEATSTPNSPEFRDFLTPTQFDALYSPAASQYAELESYFAAYHVSLHPASDRLLLGITGSPSAVGAAFHTSFAEYALGGTTFYGPTSSAVLPSALGVSAVDGLTNAFDYTPQVDLASTPASSTASPGETQALTCTTYLTPTELRDAYQMNGLVAAGDNGTGTKIAVVDTYDSAETPAKLSTDFYDFDKACGVGGTTPQYQYPYPFPTATNTSTSSGWGGETVLDMQWAHVMAQGATIMPVQTPDSGFSLYYAVNYLVETDLVDAISLSWGEITVGEYQVCSFYCNATSDGSLTMFHPVLEAAAAEGISTTVASGDCGVDDGGSIPTPDYPAADIDATGVGGTALTMATNDTWYGSEATTAPATGTCKDTDQWCGNWTSANCDNGGAAGGGWAPEPQPWYQSGWGVKDKGLRGVPDVGINVGEYQVIYYGGAENGECGTSDGAPQWAGIIATADGIAGKGLGLINPMLYAMLRAPNNASYLHDDVTAGMGNGYQAYGGWSPIVGVGTPIGSTLVRYLAAGGYDLPTSSLGVGLTASVTTGDAPLTVTFTATATGGTGVYPHYDFSSGNGTTNLTRSDVFSYIYKASGVYSASVEVWDSSGNSTQSAPVLVVVGGATGLSVALTASTTTPSVGSTVSFTATTTGGKSPYWFDFVFGDGTWSYALGTATSPHTLGHAFQTAGVYCVYANATDSNNPPEGAISNVITEEVGGATGACTPAISAQGSLNRTVCETSCGISLNTTWATTGAPVQVQVVWGDGATSLSTDASATSPAYLNHVYKASGTFQPRVYVNDSTNSVSYLTDAVTVYPLLQLQAITPSLWRAGAGANVTFAAAAAVAGTGSGTLSTVQWRYGNGESASTAAGLSYVLYLLANPTGYLVNVNATDSLGYHASVSLLLPIYGAASPVHFYDGWNLVALPGGANDYTLFGLAEAIGSHLVSVEDLTTGVTYAPGDTTGNSAVAAGDGLWVDVSGITTPLDVQLYGNSTAVVATLATGAWNAVGWSVASGTTLAGLASLGGSSVTAVSLWNASAQLWVTYVVGFDAPTSWEGALDVTTGEGVLLWSTGATTFNE